MEGRFLCMAPRPLPAAMAWHLHRFHWPCNVAPCHTMRACAALRLCSLPRAPSCRRGAGAGAQGGPALPGQGVHACMCTVRLLCTHARVEPVTCSHLLHMRYGHAPSLPPCMAALPCLAWPCMQLLEFLSCSFMGGTDVDRPLELSLQRLQEVRCNAAIPSRLPCTCLAPPRPAQCAALQCTWPHRACP